LGVNRVFDQLLDDRGRPLDDFARRDAFGYRFIEDVDYTHRVLSVY
jgi:hypothetical protein